MLKSVQSGRSKNLLSLNKYFVSLQDQPDKLFKKANLTLKKLLKIGDKQMNKLLVKHMILPPYNVLS